MSTMAMHTLHVILAGVWLGGVIFTTAVVSPALKAMKWSEAERVEVRSVIGTHYARVGTINLVLLLVFAALDGLFRGFGPVFYVEYTLLAIVFGLTAIHGAYFGRKLAELATSERHAGGAEQASTLAKQRRSLQRVSLRISQLNLLASVVVVVLAVNA
jgi:uncharacterized membrane protein